MSTETSDATIHAHAGRARNSKNAVWADSR